MGYNGGMNICCCTGHRPKGFPWQYGADIEKQKSYLERLSAVIGAAVIHDHIDEFFTGMAMGADMDFAEAVLDLRDKKFPHIRLTCIIPCPNQCYRWDKENIDRYQTILDRSNSSKILSPRYTPDCLLARNRYMVDHAAKVIAIWNGSERGGTWYTISYARGKGKPIDFIMLNSIS